MIPIGSPITALSKATGKKVTGTLITNYTKELATMSEIGEDDTGYGILVYTDSVRIRHDKPSPFTLWAK